VRQKAPPGYRKIVVVYLEPASGGFHQKSRQELIQYLRRYPERLRLCNADGTKVDELVIVNARGETRWTKGEFVEFAQPC
jgi:hypothetical protein